MTEQELFERDYIIDDKEYLERYCCDEAEAYFLEKQVNRQWLFNRAADLEDDYSEDSLP